MPGQQQIFAGSIEAAPKDYTVAANVELTLRAVNANFTDNGAGEDWLPAVVLISDSGHIIARAVDQGVTVTAGGDAEVSWFPGVKHAAGAAVSPAAWMTVALDTDAGDTAFVVDDNTATHVQFPHQGNNGQTGVVQARFAAGGTFDGILLKDPNYLYFFQSSLLWHFSGFKQYGLIEGPGQNLDNGTVVGAVSNHGEQPAATFDNSGVFLGDGLWAVDYKTYLPETVPVAITLDAFQQSGGTQEVLRANLTVIAFPIF